MQRNKDIPNTGTDGGDRKNARRMEKIRTKPISPYQTTPPVVRIMITGIVLVHVHITFVTVTVKRVASFVMEVVSSETIAAAMIQSLVCIFHPL